MHNLRRPYQMYVLNLDAGRIFWLTTILILLLALSFLAGFLIGKEKSKMESDLILQQNKKVVDELLSKVESQSAEKKEEEYKFYDLISNQSVERKREIIEESPEERVKPIEEIKKEPKILKQEPYIELGDKKINPNSPYSIQIASYTKYANAKSLADELENEQYPAYIIKAKVNGNYYYRVRVGPFSSKALTLKVLAQLKYKKGCENSYIVTE